MDYARLAFMIEPMTPQDVDAVVEIEQVAFTAPWSAQAYDYELRYNQMARYYVARPQKVAVVAPPNTWWQKLFALKAQSNVLTPAPAPIVGYGGFWLMVDEAHISTIASAPAFRRCGVGELLLVTMIDSAAQVGAQVVTLEVRVSNVGAQALYRKYAFEVVGMRKRYYSDNGEDALIMTTPPITTAEYQRLVQELKAGLITRLSR